MSGLRRQAWGQRSSDWGGMEGYSINYNIYQRLKPTSELRMMILT